MVQMPECEVHSKGDICSQVKKSSRSCPVLTISPVLRDFEIKNTRSIEKMSIMSQCRGYQNRVKNNEMQKVTETLKTKQKTQKVERRTRARIRRIRSSQLIYPSNPVGQPRKKRSDCSKTDSRASI